MSAGLFSVRSWMGWKRGDESLKGALPASLRRRVTPVGQEALGAAWRLEDLDRARFVLSSRHGEFRRTVSLLESLAAGDELSPADFSLSVHHAIIGLLSIARANPAGHSAVAAGRESFCYGLMEAIACLHENPDEPVVLIHMDDVLPEIYTPFEKDSEIPVVCALLLTKREGAALSLQRSPHTTLSDEATSASHALDFLDFLSQDDPLRLSRGETSLWRWQRHV